MLDELPALTDPDLYGNGDPHAVWAVLRRECPVSWQEKAGHAGFWAVTTRAPGLEVLTDASRFSSTGGTFLRPDLAEPFPGSDTMLTLTDPPRHSVLRRVAAALFTPKAVAHMENRAREVARRLIRQVTEQGHCDFANDLAARYPMAVTAELLGIDDEDVDRMSRYTNAAAENIEEIDGMASQEAHLEVLRYYSDVIERRRRDPRQDMVSAFTTAQADGLDITDEQIVLTCDNVAVAAGETTRHSAGSGLLALLENPVQWRALRERRADVRTAVEEILRWAAPVNHIMRTALVETTVDGVAVGAGDAVAVWLPSMNRDEAVFERSDEFHIDRQPNRHSTFGGGAHFCLGAPLARLMLTVLVEELIEGTGEITLAGKPLRIPSHITGGLRTLPVRIRPRRP